VIQDEDIERIAARIARRTAKVLAELDLEAQQPEALDQNVEVGLKRPLANGTTGIELTPVAFMRRLASIVPPPGNHDTCYFGVFAPNAAWRSRLVRVPRKEPDCPIHPGCEERDPQERRRRRRPAGARVRGVGGRTPDHVLEQAPAAQVARRGAIGVTLLAGTRGAGRAPGLVRGSRTPASPRRARRWRERKCGCSSWALP
jgi:hypothetical protein